MIPIRLEPSSQRIVVRDGDQVVAESERPLLLHETLKPLRYYLPPEDVRTDLLAHSDKVTHCPFKGRANYFARAGRPLAWTYPEPKERVAEIKDLIAFDPAQVEIEVEPQR
jgi:uncharacterized protein (DUF427 family)